MTLALRRDARARGLVATAAVLGTLALTLRSLAPVAVIATALVGVIGLVMPVPRAARARAVAIAAITATGCLAFGSALLLGEAIAPRATAFGVFAVTLAAVSEEAFFRRFLHAVLEPRGAVVAIGVGAVAFGLVHVPVYGWSVLPLDIAAGAVLGWQRWASGTWIVPMITHAVANLVVFA